VGIKGSYLSDPKANNIFKKNISEASDLYAITGNENHFYLRYDSTSEENGYAILGKIRDFKTSNKTLHSAISERIYVYVRYPQNDFKNLSITGFSIDTKHVQYPRSFNTKDLKINLISSGSCWALYELSKPGRLLDLKSINVNSISKHLEFSDWNLWIQLWTGGFSVLEGTPDNNWRWCSSNGDLIIDNKSQKSKKVILEMTLGSGYEEFSDLEIKSPWFYEKLEINVRGKFFSKTITILPGKHIIQFKSNAERVRAPYDRRALVFKVINFRLREFQP
jgi:hypothetical protein